MHDSKNHAADALAFGLEVGRISPRDFVAQPEPTAQAEELPKTARSELRDRLDDLNEEIFAVVGLLRELPVWMLDLPEALVPIDQLIDAQLED